MSLKDDLIRDEGLRLRPYKCTQGRWTIGYGRNLDDVGITRAEAEAMLAFDIARVRTDLDRALPWWRQLDERRQDALANMAFQLGVSGLLGFRKMLAALEVKDWPTAGKEARDSDWSKQTPARAERIATIFERGYL
jgi:lysozyme